MCYTNGLHRFHGWIIVHLQTRPALVVLLLDSAALALAAAAAAFAAEAEHRSHHGVPGGQRAQGPGQEVPAAQELGQVPRTTRLHHVDNDHQDDEHNDGHADANQDEPAGHRKAEHRQREYQEAQDEIEGGKPAVFGRMVPQSSGQPDGHPHEGDWIPN